MEGIRGLRAVCSAPGKVILFGEHAVVYGHPAIAAVTDQRTTVEVHALGEQFTVNGFRLHDRYHSYLKTAVDQLWKRDGAVRIQTEGGVPSASGTGSSAALTVACVAGLLQLQDEARPSQVAQDAFVVERMTQGGGSPIDTSCSTAGGGVAIAGGPEGPGMGTPLWTCDAEDRQWSVEAVEMPPLHLVVGNSGVKSRTDEQVAKVAMAMKRNPIVRERLEEAGQIARDAVPVLRRVDHEALGRLMDQAHAALATVGVNHPSVQALIDAVRAAPGTLGAKITGAGGGGSMFALTENPDAAARAIEAAGGTPFTVTVGGPGLTCIQDGSTDEGYAAHVASPSEAREEAV